MLSTRERKMRRQGGFTLVEVLLVVFVLALTAMILAAVFPSSQVSRIKAAHLSYAVSLAHQKMEELRAAGYSGVLVSPTVETPLPELPNGVQSITISQYSPNIKKIQVVITWGDTAKFMVAQT